MGFVELDPCYWLSAGAVIVADDTIGAATQVSVPVLMQVAGADKIVDPLTSKNFFDSLTAYDKTLFFYDTMYHEIYNEQTQQRKQVLNDLSNWIDSHL